MPINASHEFFEAEKKYLSAETIEEKIKCLEELIRKAPKHKGSENLLSELKSRLKRLREKSERSRKIGKGKKGIRKEGYQVVIVGKANSGKSALLGALTNAKPIVSDVMFSSREPEIGTMEYEGVKAQIVDLPAIDGKDFELSIVHGTDCVLIVAENFDDFADVEKSVGKITGRKIFVFNKIDLLDDAEKRKLDAKCKSKRLEYVLVSAVNGEGIWDLKEKIFSGMGVIRVFLKEPGKEASKVPAVLREGASVKDAAESIYKGFSRQVKETRLTGPSGKFANQKVGLTHRLKDKDVLEFHTK